VEGGILTKFRLVGFRLVAAGLLAGFALILSPIVHPLFAQAAQEQTKSPLVQTLEKLLSDKRSPERDEQLYASSVILFKAIKEGTEPTERRNLLANVLREVAYGGHANAWIDYGRCLWNGWGVSEDREAAMAAYRRAADLGSDYGAYLVAYNLYWAFNRYDEAYVYAQRALRGDDPEGAVRYLLGLMAYNGRGRSKDIPESLRLHLEASERGNGDAFFELHVYAMQGIGDRSKALYYLQEAGKRDQPRACYNLGAFYATGQMQGIPKDLTESIRWYKRAADLGNGRAAATLGVMALRGEGMDRDQAAAEAYFEQAEELGFDVDEFLELVGLQRKS